MIYSSRRWYSRTRDLALTRGGVPEPGTIRHSDLMGAGETVFWTGLFSSQSACRNETIFLTSTGKYKSTILNQIHHHSSQAFQDLWYFCSQEHANCRDLYFS